MGGGVSSLSPELAKGLSEKRRETFQDFEKECSLNNMKPVEVYLFLTNKYNLLLNEENKERLEREMEANRLQALKNSKRRTSKPSVPRLSRVNSTKNTWGKTKRLFTTTDGSEVVSSDGLKAMDSQEKFVEKAIEKTVSSDSTDSEMSMNNICLKCSTEDTHDQLEGEPVLSPIPEERPRLWNDEEDCHQAAASDAHHAIEGEQDNNEVTPECVDDENDNVNDSVNYHGDIREERRRSSTSVDILPSHCESVFDCKICCKTFTSRNMLETHISYSKLHAEAVQERANKFAEILHHAENQAKVARSVVQAMRDKLKMKRKARRGHQKTRARFLWKYAASKVIDRYLKARYYDVLAVNPQIQFPEYYVTHEKTASDAKLLYNGSKFFWRIRATYKVDIYLHPRSNVIEVIPQLVHSSVDGKQDDHTIGGTFAEWNCPRMYLSRDILERMMPSDLTSFISDVHVKSYGNDQETVAEEDDSDRDSDYDSDEDEDDDMTVIQQHNHHSNHHHIHNSSRPTKLDKAVALFVVSRLKVDYVGVNEKRVSLLRALYFDTTNSSNAPLSSSPLLELRAINALSPVAVERTKVYQQWEVRQKMSQVEESQQSLTQAVQSAYTHAKQTTKVLSPHDSFHLSPRPNRSVTVAVAVSAVKGGMFSGVMSPHTTSTPASRRGSRRWSFKV